MNLELLEHAVLNQLEIDLDEHDYEAVSEMLELLLQDKRNQDILFNYLSDSARKNLEESKTVKRY